MVKIKKFDTKKSESSKQWLRRQSADPYIEMAKKQGYRSRAAFKLIELDNKLRFIKNANRILDLGCAPGSWCQVLREKNNNAIIIGIDLLDTKSIEGVKLIKDDFKNINNIFDQNDKFDLILSDIAHNTTGHRATDLIIMEENIKNIYDISLNFIAKNGCIIVKTFGITPSMTTFLKSISKKISFEKPAASRKDSSEIYIYSRF